MPQTFVALDLETTGLSPEKDTIIEVAAIRYEVGKKDGVFYATHIEERSMLINPGRSLSEEVSMITGITDDMLTDKPLWNEVRDRVNDFIGDGIIVGHNVLFDISMFHAHGLDLSTHTVIDTFELSEIFSQEAESLNLGFLAGLYGLSAGDKEHRALGDTRLSIGLFFHYLNSIESLSNRKKAILKIAANKELYPSIASFIGLTDIGEEQRYTLVTGENNIIKHTLLNRIYESKESITLTSIVPGRDIERDFLEKVIGTQKQLTIGVFGAQQSLYIHELLDELGIPNMFSRTYGEYISLNELEYRLVKKEWKRKETILMSKLLFWIEDTKTGLLSELKLYGDERSEIIFFRMRSGEGNPFYRGQQDNSIMIEDLSRTLHENYRGHSCGQLIIKDIALIEESLRRAMSIYVDIEKLVRSLELLPETRRLIGALRWIEGIYLGIPDRPTGPSAVPPGEYGETYFFTQEDIWNRGGEHLALTNRVLIDAYHEWCSIRTLDDRHDEILMELIDRTIGAMITFHTVRENRGVVIEIKENTLGLNYIPRTITSALRTFLDTYTSVVAYGTGIDGEKISTFLREEMGLSNVIESFGEKKETSLQIGENILVQLKKNQSLGGTVILTTSARHVREIGKSLESTGIKVLMQGLSGGKGKQLGMFLRDPEHTIIIGTIGMWREELDLWKHAKHIIIAKLPFDPPTDPYFLARTVGMANNFAKYSEPMTIIKMNTLIARIRSAEFTGPIYCEDTRLIDTIWGKQIAQEIV